MGVFFVGIVLFVNFLGDLLENNVYSFGRIIIVNLKLGNNLLWLYIFFVFLYLLFIVYSMCRYIFKMCYKEDDLVKWIFFINGIFKYVELEKIKKYFEEVYFNCIVFEVCLCYNVVCFMFFDVERKKVEWGKLYFINF